MFIRTIQLYRKLPCELQNVIKLHRKLRNDKMSSNGLLVHHPFANEVHNVS